MGEYVDVGGMKTWFDSWGSGHPLLLLHGDMVTNATWEPTAPALAEGYRVLALERRGHGHTPDVEGPFSYEAMAQDTIGFLEAVVGRPAHLVGWSGGGIIALIVASRRPDLVEKMVAISANFNNVSAVDPEQVEALRGTPADSPEWAFPRSLYESTSPDGPGHWPVVFEKTKAMVMDDLSIEPKELGQITAPTLVVAADDDIIRLEHSIELYRSIPDAQLAIVPGTSHMLVLEKPDHVTRLILDFLGNEPTPTMMPIRRSHEG